MRAIRSAALSRHSAPAFVMLGGLELLQLRKLGDLPFRLFVELLAMADHATGRISTSYAVLLALLDFDQVPGAHAADKPTTKRIRTALEALCQLQLVRVDRIKNEKAQGLFLRVQSRAGISAPDGMKGRGKGRVERPKKQDPTITCTKAAGEDGQTEGQGVQEKFLSPISPSCPPEEMQRLRAVRQRIDEAAQGRDQAPQGGQTTRPQAGTPPRGLRPPESAQADSSPAGLHQVKDKGRRPRAVGDVLAGAVPGGR